MRTLDVAQLAVRQYGVASRSQLVAIGLTDGQISRWTQRGRLVRLNAGVYAVGHAQLTPAGRRLAAVLACGPGAVLSHRSAAGHWGLLRLDSSVIDVSAARSRSGGKGIRLHRPRTLRADERAIHDGVPVTTVPRTLIDLAGSIPIGVLESAVRQSLILELFDQKELDAALSRAIGKRGIRKLRKVLGVFEPQETKSSLERALLALSRRHHLPPPRCNAFVAGWEVDFFWPEARLVVETDGGPFHSDPISLHRDRERDRTLQLAGYSVLRFDDRDLRDRPEAVIAQIRSALRTGAKSPPRAA